MEVLHVHDIVKRYSGRTVVDKVEFTVNQGEIVGLLGPNGAGKTTSFKITMGMIASDGGRVVFNGEDVTCLPMYKRARLGMGYLSQEPSIFQRLTVEQNLMAIFETLEDLTRTQRRSEVDHLLDYFHLTHLREQLASTLSGGERRRLEIARALITKPSLILLDEPFSGVDPKVVEELQSHIVKLRDEQGIGILLTDHNVHQTLAVTDRSYIIHEGKALRSGTSAELIKDDLVRREYLGGTFVGDEFDERVPVVIGRKTEAAPAEAETEAELLVPPPTPKRKSPQVRRTEVLAGEARSLTSAEADDDAMETAQAVRAEADAMDRKVVAKPTKKKKKTAKKKAVKKTTKKTAKKTATKKKKTTAKKKTAKKKTTSKKKTTGKD